MKLLNLPVGGEITSEPFSERMAYLGDFDAVYDGYTNKFITGETLTNYRKYDVPLVFIGQLVEYNSFTSEFADYVEENVEEENAKMHQSYPVRLDPNKKYVEFAAYVNKITGEVCEYEIRVFDGSRAPNKDGYYAKSRHFNNTFTKDLKNNNDVDFGIPSTIEKIPVELLPDCGITYDGKTKETTNLYEEKQKPADYDYLIKIVNRIGKVTRTWELPEKNIITNKKGTKFFNVVVEYKNINPIISNLFDCKLQENGYKSTTMCISPAIFEESGYQPRNGYTYVNVVGILNENDKISVLELRRINPDDYKKSAPEYKTMYATAIGLRLDELERITK